MNLWTMTGGKPVCNRLKPEAVVVAGKNLWRATDGRKTWWTVRQPDETQPRDGSLWTRSARHATAEVGTL